MIEVRLIPSRVQLVTSLRGGVCVCGGGVAFNQHLQQQSV